MGNPAIPVYVNDFQGRAGSGFAGYTIKVHLELRRR